MREVDTILGTKDTLVLMVSRDCNIGCDFCCVPPDGHRLETDLVTDLIAQASAIAGLEVVAFTGGEPFLYLPHIPDALAECRRRGMPWKAITNSYWATDPATARRTLLPYVELGLAQLSLSADPSHQAFLPIERVEFAARAALDLGIRVHVVGAFARPGMKLSDHIALPEHPRLHTASYIVQPFGRAREWSLTRKKFGLDEPLDTWTCYSTVRTDLLVFPDGDVYPCCSTANDHSTMIYGNVRHEPLATIHARVINDFSVQIIKRRSFGYLYATIARLDPDLARELPDPAEHVSACSLCLSVFSNPQLTPRVRAVLEEHRVELLAEHIENQAKQMADPQSASEIAPPLGATSRLH